MLGVAPLFEAIQERVGRQYAAVLRHTTLRPYTGACSEMYTSVQGGSCP